jgi:hypothetical protein
MVHRPSHAHFHPACWEAVRPRGREEPCVAAAADLPPLTDDDDAAPIGDAIGLRASNTMRYRGGRSRHKPHGTSSKRERGARQSTMKELAQLAAGIQAIAPDPPPQPTGDAACSDTSTAGGNA